MTTPIVLIHYGYTEYVEHALTQAVRVAEGAKVILICDFELKTEIKSRVTQIDLGLFRDTFQAFARRYLHIGGTGGFGELFNFARWMILRDLSKYIPYDDIFYQDSDVLLTTPVSNITARARGKDMTLCNKCGPNVTWFKDISIIEKFCNLVTDFYHGRRPEITESVLAWIRQSLTTPGVRSGNICDMSFFEYLVTLEKVTFEDLANVVDGAFHIGNINPDCDPKLKRFEAFTEMPFFPNFYWKAGVPYVKPTTEYAASYPELVRVDSIHFQGTDGVKDLIPMTVNLINTSAAQPDLVLSAK